jgi:hypothetical protein
MASYVHVATRGSKTTDSPRNALVSKFAEKTATGRTYAVNSKAGGNTGNTRLKELKLGWKEGIEKESRERLQLGIDQTTPHGPVARRRRS